MASIKDTIFLIGFIACVFWIFFGFLAPLLSKIYVINPIEKRYKCKLNLENENTIRIFLHDYFKYIMPASTIAYTYFFKKDKYIERNPGLNAIHYSLKNASKQEIFMSCFIFITLISVASLVFLLGGILKLYGY